MNIVQKLKNNESVTIAFLGDSVTFGAFEIGVDDPENGYVSYLAQNLRYLYPKADLHVVNAGISGDHSRNGAKRVEADVIAHKPDLTVVCYGLNDCGEIAYYAERYVRALEEIFNRLRACGSEVIFMTPNMMNTYAPEDMIPADLLSFARSTMKRQNEGVFDIHIERARELCREMDVPVCDCYAIWKSLAANGVDTTALLCNRINHPAREMHRIFAYELVKTILA